MPKTAVVRRPIRSEIETLAHHVGESVILTPKHDKVDLAEVARKAASVALRKLYLRCVNARPPDDG